jgi:hypothetical protein
MIDIHSTSVVRDVYDARYAGLVQELEQSCADRSEAERSVQAAFMLALSKPRAFALTGDKVGWLRDKAARAARTLERAPEIRKFDELVGLARRQQRRRTAIQVALATILMALTIALFLRLGFQQIPGDGGVPRLL